MRVVVQRSKKASVTVDGQTVGHIGQGLVLLVGMTHGDTEEDVKHLADKIINLRIFADEDGKMNHSVRDIDGQLLVISQFTLYGDTRKGRRPNFMAAAKPEQAEELYNTFISELRQHDVHVETGQFGAMMQVELNNWGPVTLILDSDNT